MRGSAVRNGNRRRGQGKIPFVWNLYAALIARAREIRLLESVADLLGWDQEVVMPEGGADWRAAELELLARLAHDRWTDPAFGELLANAESAIAGIAIDAPERANVRELRRLFTRATRLPAALVGEIASVQSLAQHAWARARQNDAFTEFAPWLERLVGLMRAKAECLRDASHDEPWDALADEYEPGMRARDLHPLFAELRARVVPLVDELLASPRRPDATLRKSAVPVEAQDRLVRRVAGALGFDLGRGRIDSSTHPFCSGTHPGDVRITTRFLPEDFFDGLGSTMHETGHALYEQGLDPANAGTPLGTAASLGMHESQSRLWENRVGRSLGFWRWCRPLVRELLGATIGAHSAEELFAAANRVERSLIRVEADEATYDLHVMVRFEVETAMIRGELSVADLPAAWNAGYRELLGIQVPDDRRGCLQDVHWSCGLFGYFPTYTLGNLYAAQLFAAAENELGGQEESFARGEFAPLLAWLRTNVHRHGSRWPAAELCRRATGGPLGADAFARALEGRLRPIYAI